MLEGIQDNYTFAQPGIQMKIRQLEELLKRVDLQLHQHIVHHDVQYLQFSFRYTGVTIGNVPDIHFLLDAGYSTYFRIYPTRSKIL